MFSVKGNAPTTVQSLPNSNGKLEKGINEWVKNVSTIHQQANGNNPSANLAQDAQIEELMNVWPEEIEKIFVDSSKVSLLRL